jgi:hypothetical protein
MEKSQELVRLRIYEVYAWGVPTIITVAAAIIDNLPENSTDTLLRPRFGENKCWFYGEWDTDDFQMLCRIYLPTAPFSIERCEVRGHKYSSFPPKFQLSSRLDSAQTEHFLLLQKYLIA